MTHTRRDLMAIAGMTLAAGGMLTPAAMADRTIKAVAFDAFTIFDPRSVAAALEANFPGRGNNLSATWRTRQFEYCWLRTLSGTYVDFRQVTEDALNFTFKAANIELRPALRHRLMEAHLDLRPWPDSIAALRAMRGAGLRLAYVSNLTPDMLRTITENAGATGLFEHQLSTDAVRAFKPDPRAYRMAETAFDLPRKSIVFAAFGGWDAAGAKSFGLDTFWVNRLGVPLEELGVRPNAIGATLTDLATYVTA